MSDTTQPAVDAQGQIVFSLLKRSQERHHLISQQDCTRRSPEEIIKGLKDVEKSTLAPLRLASQLGLKVQIDGVADEIGKLNVPASAEVF
jgi:hypothetical protein